MQVIHVTDRFSGGVSSAILSIVEQSPEYEHHLLADNESLSASGSASLSLFHSYSPLPRGLARRVRAIRQLVRELDPQIIHAHSSFAGAASRLALRASQRAIVYSPHCYAFERTDTRFAWVYLTAERLLIANTSVTAACSLREASLAVEKLGAPRNRVAFLPNLPRRSFQRHIPELTDREHTSPSKRLVVGAGRISPQKDPIYFLEAVRKISESIEVEAVWIGDGDEDARRVLQESGVEVTGWLPPDEVGNFMKRAALYIHSAAWEGFPLALLEASELGTPTLVRTIPAFDFFPDRLTVEDALDSYTHSIIGGSYAEWRHESISLLRRTVDSYLDSPFSESVQELYEIALKPPRARRWAQRLKQAGKQNDEGARRCA